MNPASSSIDWSEIDVEHARHQVQQLERRVLSIHERAMRRTLVVEFAELQSPAELVYTLHQIHTRASNGSAKARELMQEFALEPSAVSQLPYETLQEGYQIAREKGLESIQGLFFIGRLDVELSKPIQHMDSQGISTNEHLELPLGIRRKAAREQNRHVLDRLLHDQNWRVIELLLDNPRITERDVVKIAARRPTQPAILELISRHPKWSGRYRIRKSLVCNPKTPYPLARSLLDTLLQQDIQEVVNLGVLDGQLMEEARLLLRRRKGPASTDLEDALAEMEDLIAQFDDDLQQEADWVSEQEKQETQDIEDWITNVTQGLIDGTLPLVPVTDEDDL